MKTQQEALNWLNASIGKQYDFDGWYGFQCVDYANAYWNFVTGGRLAAEGAKDIPFWNDFTGIATVFKNDPKFIAQPGDIVVWSKDFGGGYGHVAVVVAAGINQIEVIEQNWLSGGWTEGPKYGGTGWEVATRRVHGYETEMWFIRPNFTKSIAKKAMAAIKPVVKVAAWKFNKYGTKYRAENGTFVNGNQPIQAYYVGPFVIAKNRAGKLPAGASVKYDEVMVQDGFVWIGYTADNGKRISLPVRPHVNGIDGKAWGTFK